MEWIQSILAGWEGKDYAMLIKIVVTFEFEGIDGNFASLFGAFASAEVEGPGVPGADDFAVLKPALAKRAATVRTPVVNGRELATGICKTDVHATRSVLTDAVCGWWPQTGCIA